MSLLSSTVVAGLPRAQELSVEWPVALFALALSIVTGLIFGAVPAWQATRFDIRESLNEESRGGSGSARHRRMRSMLVVAEMALALVLLVGAGLLLRSFSALTRVSPGFNPDRLLVINLPLSPRAYGDNAVRTAAVDRIVDRIAALPGIERAGMSTMIPMAGAGATIHFNRAAFPPKGPEDYVMAGYRAVTPDYLSVLGVPLKRGRLIEEGDRAGAPPVVVINESMAKQYFPGLDPLGQRMQIGTEPEPDFQTMEVVGIVGDVKQSFEAGSKSEFFVPYAQFPDPVLTGMYLNVALVARTAGDPVAAVPSVRSALREIDSNQPLVNVRTMEGAMAGTVAQPRMQTLLLVVFAGVAVTLAIVGVSGVMASTVSQRHEIGVRMAIGASPGSVVGMVGRQGDARGGGVGLDWWGGGGRPRRKACCSWMRVVSIPHLRDQRRSRRAAPGETHSPAAPRAVADDGTWAVTLEPLNPEPLEPRSTLMMSARDDHRSRRAEVAHQHGRAIGVGIASASTLVEISAKGSAGCMIASTGPRAISRFLTSRIQVAF